MVGSVAILAPQNPPLLSLTGPGKGGGLTRGVPYYGQSDVCRITYNGVGSSTNTCTALVSVFALLQTARHNPFSPPTRSLVH